ncbi:MAG: hypothetical protein F4X39_08575 [Acidobacteriia bacterium]|nr:hypothetical protein [Terriglobia bacterium]
MPVTRWGGLGALALQEARKFGVKLLQVGRELFHQIVGFIFIAFALLATFGAGGLIPTYQQMDRDPANFWRVVALAAFVIIFGGFGVSSFRRARRVSRGR